MGSRQFNLVGGGEEEEVGNGGRCGGELESNKRYRNQSVDQ